MKHKAPSKQPTQHSTNPETQTPKSNQHKKTNQNQKNQNHLNTTNNAKITCIDQTNTHQNINKHNVETPATQNKTHKLQSYPIKRRQNTKQNHNKRKPKTK